MKPKPLESLNHLTVPVAITFPSTIAATNPGATKPGTKYQVRERVLRTLRLRGREGTSNSLLDVHPAPPIISTFFLQRKRGLVFHLLQRKAGFNVAYARHPRKKSENKLLERRHIRH